MKQIRKMTNPLISEMEKVLNRALDNVYINTALKVFLVLYAALAAPKFPPKLVFLMDNTIVRICVAFLIVFMALRDPAMALMIAIAFIVTLQTANRLRLYNTDLSIGIPGETSWLPSVKEMFFNDQCGEEDTAVEDAKAAVEDAKAAVEAKEAALVDAANEEAANAELETANAELETANAELETAESALATCNEKAAKAEPDTANEEDADDLVLDDGEDADDLVSDDEEDASKVVVGDDAEGNASFTNYENFSVYPSSGAKYSYAPFN